VKGRTVKITEGESTASVKYEELTAAATGFRGRWARDPERNPGGSGRYNAKEKPGVHLYSPSVVGKKQYWKTFILVEGGKSFRIGPGSTK